MSLSQANATAIENRLWGETARWSDARLCLALSVDQLETTHEPADFPRSGRHGFAASVSQCVRATRHGAGFKSEQLVLRHNRAILDNDSTASKGVPISDEDEIKVFW